ncbi:MAG TPA: cupin domain-containing protein [Thermoplasmata archaeon]|nr:cupin domain-containing protein [Thermoplasmata archaeon]
MWVKSFREPGKLSPPDARSLSSSCVRLAPGARVGEHVTASKEELLFVLEGEATVLVGDTAKVVATGHAAYVPPETLHDVANAATSPLTYVYVTAKLPSDGPRAGTKP